MKSIFPIILVILLLIGAITYSLAKRTLPKQDANLFGISANQLTGKDGDALTPTPSQKLISGLVVTPTIAATPTPTPTPAKAQTPTAIPTASEGTAKVAANTVTKTTTTTICTPVYGMADTCTEHVVVDTGAEDAIFFDFAGLAYIAGLASFIKAKTLKK